MQPEQATFLLHVRLGELQSEHSATKRVLEAIPADKGDFRPDPVSMSAFELAWHIASAENVFYSAPAIGEFRFGSGRPDSIKTPPDVAAWYAETFEKNYARLPELSPEQLTKVIDFRGLFQMPAISYLQFGSSHSIHHRGQLSTYLRLMGAKVPAIYGESYDSAQARKLAGSHAN